MARAALMYSMVALLLAWNAIPADGQDLDLSPGADRTVEVFAVYLGATSCDAGLALLASTAEFDQVIVGGSWSNSAAVEFIWSDAEALAGVPLVVILTRGLDRRPRDREPATRSVLVQLWGEKQMREWLDNGAGVF